MHVAFILITASSIIFCTQLLGTTHSHSTEFPDDSWNLYAMLDPATTTALNVTNNSSTHVLGIFKPYARRLTNDVVLVSDTDTDILLIAKFTSPVHIRKLMIIGDGNDDEHPTSLKCYINHEVMDFNSLDSLRPAQVFTLPINKDGTIELTTTLQPFSNVLSCAFCFTSTSASDHTIVRYVGMQGEHTHYRREAVDTVYEVLCTGSEGIDGNRHNHSHSHIHD